MGRKKGQKSPFGSQEDVVGSHQERSQSLFCFFSCPGHEETGRSRKGPRSLKEHRKSPPQLGRWGGLTMPLHETFRRRKPAFKALFPWPGFFLLDQNLPDRLLGLHRDGFCPFQVTGQSSGTGCMFQLRRKGIVDSLSSIQIAPQQRDNDQGAKGKVRQHIQGASCTHGAPAAKA